MSLRIVVTGTGLVCPTTCSVPDLLGAEPTREATGTWFDPVRHLGARGWRYLTPATRYLLAASRYALADAAVEPAGLNPESMGVVIGTNFAARQVVARMDEVVVADGADALSPAEAPNFSINLPASQVSMRYAMRAFNLSLTNPMVAGLESILTLTDAIRRDRARLGVAGATEERPTTAVHPMASEGACCFTLERLDDVVQRGGTARAEVAGGFSRFVPSRDPGAVAAVGRRVRALVAATGASRMPYASVSGAAGWAGRLDDVCAAECAAAGVALVPRRYPGADGRHVTVSALLQAAGLLAEHGHGLVLAASPHGHVAAVLLRPVDGYGRHRVDGALTSTGGGA